MNSGGTKTSRSLTTTRLVTKMMDGQNPPKWMAATASTWTGAWGKTTDDKVEVEISQIGVLRNKVAKSKK